MATAPSPGKEPLRLRPQAGRLNHGRESLVAVTSREGIGDFGGEDVADGEEIMA